MEITSNFNEVLIDIERMVTNIVGPELDRMLNDITVSIHRNNRRRIHEQGIDTHGSLIGGGNYSQKNMLVGAKSFKTTSMANSFFNKKDNEWVTVNGKALAVVSGGYKKFRELNNLKSNKVNLEFTGDLKRSFTYQKSSPRRWVVGFSDNTNADKREHLENKYNQTIWGVGLTEQNDIDKIINFYLKKM